MTSRLASVVCVLSVACGGANGPTPPEVTTVIPTPSPTPTPIVQTLTGSMDASDPQCSSPGSARDNKPCRRYPFTTTTSGEFDAILTWTGMADLEMEAWRGSSRFMSSASLGAAMDRMRTILEPGSYELRVVYNAGSTPADYTLQLKHPQ